MMDKQFNVQTVRTVEAHDQRGLLAQWRVYKDFVGRKLWRCTIRRVGRGGLPAPDETCPYCGVRLDMESLCAEYNDDGE